MPEPIIMKLGIYIMPYEAIKRRTLQFSSFSSTNIAASQIVAAVTLILFECLNL
jgi:hypothetical protein